MESNPTILAKKHPGPCLSPGPLSFLVEVPLSSPQETPRTQNLRLPGNLSCKDSLGTVLSVYMYYVMGSSQQPQEASFFVILGVWMRNRGTERLSNLPKVTERASCRARIPTQAVRLGSMTQHCLPEHSCGLASGKLNKDNS